MNDDDDVVDDDDDQVADQFHDLAPYASTDILRNQIPPLYQVSHSYDFFPTFLFPFLFH